MIPVLVALRLGQFSAAVDTGPATPASRLAIMQGGGTIALTTTTRKKPRSCWAAGP